MKPFTIVASVIAAGFILSACGQMGPLYLPPNNPDAPLPSNTQTTQQPSAAPQSTPKTFIPQYQSSPTSATP